MVWQINMIEYGTKGGGHILSPSKQGGSTHNSPTFGLELLLVQKSSARWCSFSYLLSHISYILSLISYLISLISYLLSLTAASNLLRTRTYKLHPPILWTDVQDAFFSSSWHEFDESRNQMMKKNSDFWVSATVLYRVETNIFVVPFRELSLLAKIMQKRKIFCFYAKIESGNFDFKPSAVHMHCTRCLPQLKV